MTSLMTRGSLFDDFFKDVAPGFFIKPLHGDALPAASQIRVDVKENEKEYSVHAEIPGVNKEDIQVSIEGNVVTLRAEIRQQDKQAEGEKVLRSERYYGAVSRSFQLPADIDETAAKARYENGVLLLTLPKKVSSVPQRLVVE
jgi:HSP20 family protein